MSETRDHILQTSLLLFLQKSYKEVTMRDIVESTGMSKGAFYHYFTGKEELFKEIVYLFFRMGTMEYNSFPKDSFKAFIDEYLKRIDNSFKQINAMMGGDAEKEVSFNFFFIMFDAMKRFPEMLKMEEDQYKNDVAVWEDAIANAKNSDEVSSNSTNREIADLFLYCTDGVFIRALNTEEQTKYKDKLQQAFYSIYNNIKV